MRPTDYEAVEDEVVEFGPCQTQHCLNLSITDDLTSEPEERFSVSLSRSAETHVIFSPVAAEVVIADDDGEKTLPY